MKRQCRRAALGVVALICASAFAPQAGTRQQRFPAIDAGALLRHISVLSSDKFEGRLPGTRGEELTVSYIADELKKAGVSPGAADGTYFQKVPLVGMTPARNMVLTLRKGSATDRLQYLTDFVAWTRREVPSVRVENSPLVFVGYGVHAPEFKWDDYKGVDVRGKTLVMLVNDPPVPDSRNPKKLDPSVFGGEAMTYYGRWTYKYDIAAEKGAAAVLLIHETEPAGYPWSVVESFSGERFDLMTPNRNMDKTAFEAWITMNQARNLLVRARQNLEVLKRRAATREFRPVPLDVTASLSFGNTMRRVDSRNVVGRVDGADARLKGECVVYTAHWDHFGSGPKGIYHGAADNASGVGGMIEIGRAFARSKPKRPIVLVAVTGEEQGLLGSAYYATHPVVPLSSTLADINLDMLNLYGRTRDVTLVGLGKSDLDDYARRAASEQGRIVHGDLEPSKGYYYRSDHFEFAKRGVPGLYVDWVRRDFIGRSSDFGRNVADRFTERDYHKPSDVIKPEWDTRGAVEDLQLEWRVGYDLAQAGTYPQWKPGAEFRRKTSQ